MRDPVGEGHQRPDTSCRVNCMGSAHAAIRIQCARRNEKASRCRARGWWVDALAVAIP